MSKLQFYLCTLMVCNAENIQSMEVKFSVVKLLYKNVRESGGSRWLIFHAVTRLLGLQSGGNPCRQSMQRSTKLEILLRRDKERKKEHRWRGNVNIVTSDKRETLIHTVLTITFTRSAIYGAFKKGGAAKSGRRGTEEVISSNWSSNRHEWVSKGPHRN